MWALLYLIGGLVTWRILIKRDRRWFTAPWEHKDFDPDGWK